MFENQIESKHIIAEFTYRALEGKRLASPRVLSCFKIKASGFISDLKQGAPKTASRRFQIKTSSATVNSFGWRHHMRYATNSIQQVVSHLLKLYALSFVTVFGKCSLELFVCLIWR